MPGRRAAMSEPTPVPDIHDGPLPDFGHESLRLSVVQALDDLETKTAQIGGALLLVQTAFHFAQTSLTAVTALQAAVTGRAAQVAALQDTVTAQAAQIATQADEITALQTQVAALENPTPAGGPA